MKKCYYYIAQKQLDGGDYKKALKNFKKADDKLEAQSKAAQLEIMFMRDAAVGDKVTFGNGGWTVLENDGSRVLILRNKVYKAKAFDNDGGNVWTDSSLRKWLNKKQNTGFSSDERNYMEEQYLGKPAEKGELAEKQFLLTEAQYKQYMDIIPAVEETYWLKDSGPTEGMVKCVAADGSVTETYADSEDVFIRQAIWVSPSLAGAQ